MNKWLLVAASLVALLAAVGFFVWKDRSMACSEKYVSVCAVSPMSCDSDGNCLSIEATPQTYSNWCPTDPWEEGILYYGECGAAHKTCPPGYTLDEGLHGPKCATPEMREMRIIFERWRQQRQ